MKKESWMYSDTKVKTPKKDLSKLPDPKKHQTISFVKSAIRLGACALGFFGLFEAGFIGLFLAEIVGIGEELV
jgi:hypothetical protein